MSHSDWVQRVEEEVVKCDRTALVLPKNVLPAEIEYLSKNYPAAKFYRGEDVLKPEPIGTNRNRFKK